MRIHASRPRRELGRFLALISWETEVWIADDPDHLIHFDGERVLGPYADPAGFQEPG